MRASSNKEILNAIVRFLNRWHVLFSGLIAVLRSYVDIHTYKILYMHALEMENIDGQHTLETENIDGQLVRTDLLYVSYTCLSVGFT